MLVLLMLGYVLSFFDRQILVMMIEPIGRDLHLTDTHFALLYGFAFALFYTVVGLFFGLVGVFAGPFVGAVVGELIARRGIDRDKLGQATKVGFGTWFGIFVGTVLKLTLAFAMIGIFAIAWWHG